MRFRRFLLVGFTWMFVFASHSLWANGAKDQHVVMICIDGLPSYLFDDPNAVMPTIRQLAATGVRARGMTVSNPSVTWPNHTSLVTGVHPEKHGVLFNGMLERSGPGLPVKVNPKKDERELIHAPTSYEILHQQGLTIAAINWPCTRNSVSIDDNFPDVPDSLDFTTPRLITELKHEGLITETEFQTYAKLGTIARDRIWTDAVCHVIRKRMPNLVLFHLLNVDSTHHRYGPATPAGYTAVALADTLVKSVVEAIDRAGIRERTTILIVSDHGFIATPRTLLPNVVLRQAGLLTTEGTSAATARAHIYPEGGIGMVYLTVPDSYQQDRKTVIDLFRDCEGVEKIITPDDFGKYGLPLPSENPQMADLILVAKEGYLVGGAVTGDDFVIGETTPGSHGYLSTNPKMNATLIIQGPGIRKGETVELVENIDIAPTIGRRFGVPLPNIDGKALESIFEPDPRK